MPGIIVKLDLLYRRMKEVGACLLEFELGPQEKLRLVLRGSEVASERGREGEGERARGREGERGLAQANEAAGFPVNAPLSGIFYRASSPSSPAFVEVGSLVKAGDIVCIIEAMKVMNEIRAPKAGKVAGISGVNGKHVKKGERIFSIEE